MTNYGRIKNMSVEEMAIAIFNLDFIDNGLNCENCCAYTKDGECNKTDNDGKGTCIDGIKKWLESEVQENE